MKCRLYAMMGLSMLSGLLFSAKALAVLINIDVSASDSYVYFAGHSQESSVKTQASSSAVVLDLEYGEVVDVSLYSIWVEYVGAWESVPFNLSQGHAFTALLSVGLESLLVEQKLLMSQIMNNQFMFDLTRSVVGTINIAGIGTLEVLSRANSWQGEAQSSDYGVDVITSLRLVPLADSDDVNEVPAPAGMLMLAGGLLGLVRLRKPNN